MRRTVGPETASFDAVVGADGLWSKIREALGDRTLPAYRGYVAWRATIARQQAPAEIAGDETGLWLGTPGHVVHYPIAAGRQINIVVIDAPDGSRRRAGQCRATAEELRRASPRVPSPCGGAAGRRTIGSSGPSTTTRPAISLADGSRFSATPGIPVLPFLAQGAALAIEDAAALAAALDGASDVEAALKALRADRLRRVRRVQRAARLNGRVYHRGPARRLRPRPRDPPPRTGGHGGALRLALRLRAPGLRGAARAANPAARSRTWRNW